jgi:hypothetical protein
MTASLRASYLGVLALLHFSGLAMMFLFADQMPEHLRRLAEVKEVVQQGTDKAEELARRGLLLNPLVQVATAGGFITIWPALWTAWAFLFRGGLTLKFMGIRLVRRDGRKAGRFQCAWRVALLWAPVVALLLLATSLKVGLEGSSLSWLHGVAYALAGLVLLVYLAVPLLYPGRPIHDRLARVYLVPK